MDLREEESAPLVIRDWGGSQRSRSTNGPNLQVHLYFLPSTKNETTIHISSGQISAENVCIQACKKCGKTLLTKHGCDPCKKWLQRMPLYHRLVYENGWNLFHQESYQYTKVFLVWRPPICPFGILRRTCSTQKKTYKFTLESGRWEVAAASCSLTYKQWNSLKVWQVSQWQITKKSLL